ncbi:unnamed protein product [Hydatigera taeniaeformis]|uniref:Phosphotransferase n=1 Tax=Hydatigena taeniaeformis TaxID=6205 RepID=A0A0R3X4Y5_HYDTA|nr:unnamed protein product [Hydatigera taeniaeformis]
MHRMNIEMTKGLSTPNDPTNDLKMLNTYVTDLPNGNETGRYLALDLGGTNYRLLLVTFHAPKTPPLIEADVYTISNELQTGKGDETRNLLDVPLDLGFTFSFPVNQEGLSRGTLIRWTKGFDVPDVVGKDIVVILNKAMTDLGLKVTCRALVNDTVGALASCAFLDPETAIGLIVGTGTNAAYVEQLSAAKKITDLPKSAQSVVINIEWGAFGEHGCLEEFATEFDGLVDTESLNPGKQTFEKMISGMYLGEIVRYILKKLASERIIFEGLVPERLDVKDGFPAYFLSEVDRDPTHLFYSTEYILREAFRMTKFTTEDLKIVRYVCSSVANRAASFAASGVACLLNRIDRPRTTIAVDGSLFKFHPTFARTMVEVITKLIPPRCTFRLKLSEDGSGKGAGALVAAVKRAIVED